MKPKEYKYKINGIKFTVSVGEVENNNVHVEVNGIPYNVELDETRSRKPTISQPVKGPQSAPRTEAGEKVIAKPKPAASSAAAVKSPLPGTITKINVSVGQQVGAGSTVCMLEAMKMENDVHTVKGGTVKQILVNVGDTVLEGTDIMIIE